MNPELKNKFILALSLKSDVSDADFEAALDAHVNKVIEGQKGMEEEKPEVIPPVPPVPAANTDLTAAIAAANDQVTALRALRADVALGSCVDRGIITAASRETEKTTLLAANDEAAFASAIEALMTRKPIMRIKPEIASGIPQDRQALIAANSDAGRATLRAQKINEVKAELAAKRPSRLNVPGDYETAAAIAASREPELFAH